ncbi:MAG: large conductance mechanosensitive channel protein MscL [Lachnospiraceae bacterium]|nr:large conductance mechanosensitive channel protein MscL [Lachnospiraceae bacterium]
MKIMKEFKEFAVKGNMMDLAVGVIIGGAFSALVNSLVNDVIMPLLSLITRNIDFNNLFIALDGGEYETLAAAQEAGAATINYGKFISGIITFIIMAFVVFLIVKGINKLRKPKVAAATTKKCPFCQSDIPIGATRCPHCTSEIGDDKK